MASTVLDRFDQEKTPVNKEVVYAEPKADISKIDCNEEELTEAQRTEVRGLLEHMSHTFASGNRGLGCANSVEHEIHLREELPFKELYCRVPPGQLEEFRDAIHYLLDTGRV